MHLPISIAALLLAACTPEPTPQEDPTPPPVVTPPPEPTVPSAPSEVESFADCNPQGFDPCETDERCILVQTLENEALTSSRFACVPDAQGLVGRDSPCAFETLEVDGGTQIVGSNCASGLACTSRFDEGPTCRLACEASQECDNIEDQDAFCAPMQFGLFDGVNRDPADSVPLDDNPNSRIMGICLPYDRCERGTPCGTDRSCDPVVATNGDIKTSCFEVWPEGQPDPCMDRAVACPGDEVCRAGVCETLCDFDASGTCDDGRACVPYTNYVEGLPSLDDEGACRDPDPATFAYRFDIDGALTSSERARGYAGWDSTVVCPVENPFCTVVLDDTWLEFSGPAFAGEPQEHLLWTYADHGLGDMVSVYRFGTWTGLLVDGTVWSHQAGLPEDWLVLAWSVTDGLEDETTSVANVFDGGFMLSNTPATLTPTIVGGRLDPIPPTPIVTVYLTPSGDAPTW